MDIILAVRTTIMIVMVTDRFGVDHLVWVDEFVHPDKTYYWVQRESDKNSPAAWGSTQERYYFDSEEEAQRRYALVGSSVAA